MVKVYGQVIDGEDIVIDEFKNEADAEVFCEQWGWRYDDGVKGYSMYYLGKADVGSEK